VETSELERRFLEIYRAEHPYVVKALKRMGIAAVDLEDVRQEVFVRALRAISAFEANRPVRSWLFALTLHAVLDFRKQRFRRERLSNKVQSYAGGGSLSAPPDEALAQAQDRELIMRALESLPMKTRAVLIMVELGGASAPFVAETMKIPLNTVYSRLRLARAAFAAALRRVPDTSQPKTQ
jgi:RNA polymerase sigma-70 factor (ECF subfamily)